MLSYHLEHYENDDVISVNGHKGKKEANKPIINRLQNGP